MTLTEPNKAEAAVQAAGRFAVFVGQTIRYLPQTLGRYRGQTWQAMNGLAWGRGSVLVDGGILSVLLIMGAAMGASVAIEAFSILNLMGFGPLSGIVGGVANVREMAPLVTGIAFAIQAGTRMTAEIGAMRISEEIDALESVAIHPIPYLVTTRVLASAMAVIPLFVVCLALNFLVCQLVVFLASGQASGTYLHYFTLMLSGRDMVFAVIKVAVFVAIMSTVQCYYGFYAAGGPQGVGIAAGRAMRLSITLMVVTNMMLTMAFWGVDSGGRLGG